MISTFQCAFAREEREELLKDYGGDSEEGESERDGGKEDRCGAWRSSTGSALIAARGKHQGQQAKHWQTELATEAVASPSVLVFGRVG